MHESVEKTDVVNAEISTIGKRARISTFAANDESDSVLGKRKNKDACFNAKIEHTRP